MRHPIRLILALFFIAMTYNSVMRGTDSVMRGNSLNSALNATCATFWLMAWREDK
jgi:hypothetical protein